MLVASVDVGCAPLARKSGLREFYFGVTCIQFAHASSALPVTSAYKYEWRCVTGLSRPMASYPDLLRGCATERRARACPV